MSPAAGPPTTNGDALAAFAADVEDYFQVEALRHLCPRDRWTSMEDRTDRNTRRLLDLLAAHGARGTFFVLGWTAERHPELVREIAAGGHEVASHGYAHELVYRQSPETFREDVRRARKLLQDLSGQEVIGYRAPSYTIVRSTLWALPILMEEGYRYDSSVFPIKRLRYGMPGAPRWPHRMTVPGHPALPEFPLPTVRFGPLNVPATGGAYLRLLPFGFQRWAISRLVQSNRPFVVTIHPWELDPDQPRLPVGRRTRWTHYHNLHRTAERLSGLLALSRFSTQRTILEKLQLL